MKGKFIFQSSWHASDVGAATNIWWRVDGVLSLLFTQAMSKKILNNVHAIEKWSEI
jgi:hypothetical protein